MDCNLTIDQGNTCAKLALWTRGEHSVCIGEKAFKSPSPADVLTFCHDHNILSAIYCSVSRRGADIKHVLRTRCPNFIELKHDTPTPLRVDYATPETLAVDRLAAAVGAYTLTGGNTDILVSDVGTAITYDHVSRDNVYHGGNIAPGIFMRLKALNHYTARLPLVEPEEVPTPLWGQSTETALCSGAILGVVAELEYYRSQLPPAAVVVLGGGGTHLLRDRLPFQHTVVNNLVSLGLNTIIRFNENAETHI